MPACKRCQETPNPGPPHPETMPAKRRHVTAAADRLPLSQMVAYGMGAVVANVAVNSLVQLSSLVYVVGLGVSAVWIGYTQAIPRLWDAVADPFMGSLSDNCRSRFGRRIPFLVVGGALVGVAFAILWMVPRDWGRPAMFAYFVAASLFFYTTITVYTIPHGALGLELTGDYHEKTRLFAVTGFINNVAGFSLPWIYYLANRPVFHGDEVAGVRWVGMGMGLLLTCFALTCAFVCREPRLEHVRHQAKVPVLESFRVAWRNRTFVRLATAFVLLYTGFQLVMGFSNFISIYYLYGGDKEAASRLMAWNGTLWAVVGILGVFPMAWMSARMGKRATVIFAFIIISVGNLSKIVCYNPALPWLNLIPTALISLGMVFAFSIVYSMISDICDEDELATGVRREGVYSAVYAWLWKVAVSIASVANGYIIVLTGFNAGAVRQAASTLYWVRFWEIGLPPLLCVLGILLLRGYGLTEERAYVVKAALKARAGAAPAPAA